MAICVIGVLLLTRVHDSLLFGVEAISVLTFVVMSGVMVVVALLASYGPARQASSVDPMVSLRAERGRPRLASAIRSVSRFFTL